MKPDTRQSPTPQPHPHSSASPKQLDAFAARLIRRKARQLVGRAGFTRSDRDDIEQELALKLLKQLSAFDPGEAHWHVFVTTVVERYAASLLRDKRAEKRDHRRATSLHVLIETGDNGPVELAETVGRREQDARLGRDPRSDEERAQLAGDVADQGAGFRVDAVDTTGAGDCFAGGFLAGLMRGMNLEEAARLGNASGALSVSRLGSVVGLLPFDATIEWMRAAQVVS